MKIYLFTFLYVGMSMVVASPQIPQLPETLPSPTATSLGEYGEVPVSLFTGIPNIKINLFDISIGNHTLPINLIYHSGGIRPDQHPGPLGLGWSLSAGGCITRTINDLPDEYDIQNNRDSYTSSVKEVGYYYKHGVVAQNNSINEEILKTNISNMVKNDIIYYDTEPDVFNFNFLDFQGCFFLDSSGEWKVQCDRSLIVKFDNDFTSTYANPDYFSETDKYYQTLIKSRGMTHSFKKFTIIDEYGTNYIFGGDDVAIEFSTKFYEQNYPRFIANTWNLKQIIYPDNSTMEFRYYRPEGTFIAQMYKYYIENRVSTQSGNSWSTKCSSGWNGDISGGFLIIPSYLSGISTYNLNSNTKIKNDDFSISYDITKELQYNFSNLNNDHLNAFNGDKYSFLPFLTYQGSYPISGMRKYPDCLQAIKWQRIGKIYHDRTGVYSFNYNNDSTQRLILTGIEHVYSDSPKTYKFEYYDPSKLPSYFSSKTDHWGFYNDAAYNFPNFDEMGQPNPDVANYGTLKKIIYPTGGCTVFEYEPHQYSSKVNEQRTGCVTLTSDQYAGGIRIRRITNKTKDTDDAESYVTEYFYINDYQRNKNNIFTAKSSGILYNDIKYSYEDYIVKSSDNSKYKIGFTCSQSILPFSPLARGMHLGYSEVTEKYPDGGYSIYKYYNFDENPDMKADVSLQDTPTMYAPYTSHDIDRGRLKSKEDFDCDGKFILKTSYEYVKDNESNFVRSMKLTRNNACMNAGSMYYEGFAYRLNYYRWLISKIKETEEDKTGKKHHFTTEFAYNSVGLPIQKIISLNSKNLKEFTYTYPENYSSTNQIYKEMHSKHCIANIIEKCEFQYIDGIKKLVMKHLYEYTLSNIYSPTKIYESHGESEYRNIFTFSYDIFGNITEVVPINSPRVSYIWSYGGNKLITVAKGFNSSVYYRFKGFEDTKTPDYDNLRTAVNTFSNIQPFYLKYNNRGFVSSIIDPKENTLYYCYDGLNRITNIKNYRGNTIESYEYNYILK